MGEESGGGSGQLRAPLQPAPPSHGARLGHLAEARLQQGQEDAGDADVVPGLGQARVLPVHGHADGAGKVSHRHLVGLQGETGLGTCSSRRHHQTLSLSHPCTSMDWGRLDRTEPRGRVASLLPAVMTLTQLYGLGETVPLHPKDWGQSGAS